MKSKPFIPSLCVLLMSSVPLLAHHGGAGEIDEFAMSPFLSGVFHPWTGIGHWLVAVGVGFWLSRPAETRPGGIALPLIVLGLLSGFHSPNLAFALGMFASQLVLTGATLVTFLGKLARVRTSAAVSLAMTGIVLNLLMSRV